MTNNRGGLGGRKEKKKSKQRVWAYKAKKDRCAICEKSRFQFPYLGFRHLPSDERVALIWRGMLGIQSDQDIAVCENHFRKRVARGRSIEIPDPEFDRSLQKSASEMEIGVEKEQEDGEFSGIIPPGKRPRSLLDHDYESPEIGPVVKGLLAEIASKEQENALVKAQLQSKVNKQGPMRGISSRLSAQIIREFPTRCQFYTNLPNVETFDALLEYHLDLESLPVWRGTETVKTGHGSSMKLSAEDAFFILLVRLRHGFTIRYLCENLQVSKSTLSQLLTGMLHVVELKLRQLLEKIPDSKNLSHIFPDFYEKFPTCQLVIDCTELRMQQPSSLRPRKQLYSHYKGTTTLKYLVRTGLHHRHGHGACRG